MRLSIKLSQDALFALSFFIMVRVPSFDLFICFQD
jgi:hypothetical protein